MPRNSTLALIFLSFFCLGMASRPSDVTPPEVSITNPSTNNAIVSGIVNIQAQARDNVAVSKIEFYIDNVLKATGYASSASYDWDTFTAANAVHILKVIAYDTAKNTKITQIDIIVNNTVPLAPAPAGNQLPISLAVVSSFSNNNKSAARTIDNNLSTYWQGQYGTLSGRRIFTAWWLRLDLSKPYSLSKISIFWDKDYGAADYSIQGSNDYVTWVNLLANLSSAAGATSPNQKDHSISGAYRYIRIYIRKAQIRYPKIYEVRLYGQEPPADTTPPEIIITSPQDNFLTNQKNITINYTVDGQPRSETRPLAEGPNTLTVTAADAAGNSSSKSINVILDTTAPIPPRQLSAVAGDGKTELLWVANYESDLAGYNLYRSQVAGAGYAKINTSPVSAASYKDTGLTNGATYYYVVTALDAPGNESGYSNEVSVIPEGGPSETEPNNDFSSANPIQPGAYLKGNINPQRDWDYFKIPILEPGKLYINVSGLPSSRDLYLYLYDANQNYIAEGYRNSGNSIILEKELTSAGDYYIRLTYGGDKIFSYRLNVDVVTLWIIGAYASPNPFSPNADGKKDTAAIYASATAESNFTINIKDAQNNIIRTFTGSGTRIEQAWDGKDNSGAVAPDGVYTYTVDAVDLAGLTKAPQVSGTITVDNTLPAVGITEPVSGAVLSGTVSVKGIADDLSFRHWVLYLGRGAVPAEWNSIILGFTPQPGGILYDWDTTSLPNGDYILKLQVWDMADNISEFFLPIRLNNTNIYNVLDAPDPFSPNADGRKDALTIKASLTTPSNWTINIKDAQNNIKRTFTGSGTSIEQLWDGKDNSGVVVSDGIYTYTIDAVDPGGANAPQVSGQAIVDSTLPEGSITAPAAAQTLSGKVEFYGTATDVNFYYGDLSYGQGTAPANWVYFNSFSGTFAEPGLLGAWDIVNIPSGDYTVRLRLYDYAGNIRDIELPVKIYDVSIYSVSATPGFFSPNGDGQQDVTNIRAAITALCDWAVNIKNAQGGLIRTFTGNGTTIEQAWDGKDNSGAVAPDGVYTYTIDAADPAGGASAPQVSGQVTLDNTEPTAAIVTPAPGANVSTNVAVKGLCDDANFSYWRLSSGQGSSPERWGFINIDGAPLKPDAGGNPGLLSNWNIKSLANGDYVLRLEVWDKAGNKFTANTPVIVKNEGPDVTDLAVAPSPFTPDGLDADITNDVTKITFRLSDNGFIKVGVYDKDMNLVKSICNSDISLVPGSNAPIAFRWNGIGDNGQMVRNGEYKVVVSSGYAKQASAAVIVNDQPIFDHYRVEPQTFSPNGDGIADTAALAFSLSEDSNIKVEVYNSQDLPIRTLTDNVLATAGRLNKYAWDGKDNGGLPADQGRYYFKASAAAVTGSEAAPLKMHVFLSATCDVRVSKDTFKPHIAETTDILYRLEREAKLSIKIYDAQDKLVRDLISGQIRAAGEHSETWDGKDNNGKILPDGYYYFTIEDAISGTSRVVYDPSGTGGYDISHSISFLVSDFDPLKNKPAILTYNLPRPAKINIKVRPDKYQGPALRVIKYQEPAGSGERQCVWDGRDEFGNILALGSYTLAVWGYTLPDNAVVIEGGRPVISGVTVEPIKFSPVFNPYAQAAQNSTTITFNLSQGADTTLDIYNSSNILVRKLLNTAARPAGINNAAWDGKNEQGQVLPNDYYRIEIQAQKGDNYSDVVTAHTEVFY